MGVDKYNLCAIIEACAKGGVSQMKFGGIELYFFRPEIKEDAPPPQVLGYNAGPQVPDKKSASFDPDVLEDLRISQLMIDDPHGFEQEIIDSHLSR